jgi:hypothetical protein
MSQQKIERYLIVHPLQIADQKLSKEDSFSEA